MKTTTLLRIAVFAVLVLTLTAYPSPKNTGGRPSRKSNGPRNSKKGVSAPHGKKGLDKKAMSPASGSSITYVPMKELMRDIKKRWCERLKSKNESCKNRPFMKSTEDSGNQNTRNSNRSYARVLQLCGNKMQNSFKKLKAKRTPDFSSYCKLRTEFLNCLRKTPKKPANKLQSKSKKKLYSQIAKILWSSKECNYAVNRTKENAAQTRL